MPTTLDVQGSGQKRESARGHQTQVLHLPQPHLLNLTLVGAWHSSEPDSSPELRDPGQSQESPKPKVSPACKPGGSREWGQWGRDKVGVRTQGSLLQAQPWVGLSCPQNKAQTPVFASEGSLHDSGQKHLSLPSLLVGKKTTSPFNYGGRVYVLSSLYIVKLHLCSHMALILRIQNSEAMRQALIAQLVHGERSLGPSVSRGP